MFRGIAAYTRGENFAAGWSPAAFTQVSGPGGLQSFGMVSSQVRGLVWLVRTPSSSYTDLPAANGNVESIGGLVPDRRYTVQWWDTVRGVVTSATTQTSSASGDVTLSVPRCRGDPRHRGKGYPRRRLTATRDG